MWTLSQWSSDKYRDMALDGTHNEPATVDIFDSEKKVLTELDLL